MTLKRTFSIVLSLICRFKFYNRVHSKDDNEVKFPACWDDAILGFPISLKRKEETAIFSNFNFEINCVNLCTNY